MASTLERELRRRTGLPEVEVDDEPHESGGDRYAIYSIIPARGFRGGGERLERERREIATTSAEGIGVCLVTLRDEGQITNNSRVGILDRETRQWVINPWGKGDA
jgi:hypothetical protein